MEGKVLIFVSRDPDVGMTLKYTIPKGILNETWLVIKDHKYIYITGKNEFFIPVGFRDNRLFLIRKTGVEFHGLPLPGHKQG